MPSKRDIVEHLTRDELLAVVDRFDMAVTDTRRRNGLVEAVASSTTATRIAILRKLSHDRLKELCRTLGLNDAAAAKALLVKRLAARKTTTATGLHTRRRRANQDSESASDSTARATKSNIKFETLAEAVPQIVWITDPDGRNIYFNKQWVDYTGLTLEESYGHGWNIPFHPDDRLRAWEAWQHAVRTDGVYSLECRLRRADGIYRWWLIRGTALHDEKGRVVNWYGTWTDVEDIKQTEEALKRARDDAEAANRKLQQAYDEIRTLYEKTKALNQFKTQMFANVSHELRTPLTLILGPIETLLSTDLPEGAADRLRLAQRNARGLLKQINDLLDVARLEAGKTSVTYYETDVAKLIRHLASSFDSSAREKQIRFTVVTPPLLTVETDVEKFERILVNLLSNAFKFTPAGGTIRCQLHENTESFAVIDVADSGPGVPESFRSTIFEQFFQIPGTTRFGGTGLGLSIVKEFVELQHGRVTVGESPEGGSLFRLDLPIVAPKDTPVIRNHNMVLGGPAFVEGPAPRSDGRRSARTRSREPLETFPGPKLRKSLVLVVEDNPDMRDYICETLGTNADLDTAENGREGVERARAIVPDLIISDIMMPEMSGEAMFREIRGIRELETIPFILVTAKADEELRMDLLREGAIDYLFKPFAQEELRSKARNLLAVKASEAKYRGLMESAQDSILVISEDGKIKFANHQTTAWFGYANEELVGATMEMLFPERFRDSYVTQQNEYLTPSESKRSPDRNIESCGRRKDGAEFPVSIALSALYTPEGLLITAIVRDISVMKKRSEANLARAARLTMMGAMAGSIVHEIGQPLSAMTTNGNACLRWLAHQPPNLDEVRLSVGDIVKDGRRASDIIKSIRSLAGKSAPEMLQLDVNGAIREVFVLMRSELRRRNVTLESELSCLEPVLADRVQFQQVVLNLMMNGIEAMSSIADQARVLRVGSRVAGRSVVVTVEDSGPGLAPETMDHLFEAFFTTKAAGMGMGLSICRSIVEAHGGRLSASSRSPRGATFEFTVPIAAERLF